MAEEISESLLNEGKTDNTDANASDNGSTPEGAATEWFYDEGVPGVGEKPEWLDNDKYKSVVDAAKGNQGLRQKLGGFTGAPRRIYLYQTGGARRNRT